MASGAGVVVEGAVRVKSGMNPTTPELVAGRLILTGEALYFIGGATVVPTGRGSGSGFGLGIERAANRGAEEANEHFDALLGEVRELPPEEQLRRVAGSTRIPWDDIERIELRRGKGPLELTTARLGEHFCFNVPRERLGEVSSWVDEHSR